MIRTIININDDLCNGCGICATACHEGAIGIINGKAKLLREDYCDGLGDCLPTCPTGAITFEKREALPYNEDAVKSSKNVITDNISSKLNQWPVQIKLVSPNADYFDNCDLLIAADCTAYAYGNFHKDFISNHVTLIGCPKLDDGDYSEKLTEIFKYNNINSVTVTRMIVPCCGGIEFAVKKAIENSGKDIDLNVVTIGINGEIVH